MAARYEIRVRGSLGEMLLGAFPCLRVRAEAGVIEQILADEDRPDSSG